MRGDQLQRYLQQTVARRVSLTLDDDRHGIVRAEPASEDEITVRLHGSFLDAPSAILKALVRFLRRPEPHLRRRVMRLYRRAGLHRVGDGTAGRRIVLRHRGRFFDLKEVFDGLNRRHFDGRLKAFVTWGRRTRPGERTRSIHFGSYNWARQVIRVHPDLDRGFVPRHFVESVLFHEMLHVELGVSAGRDGRRRAHTAEFRRREKAWPGYQRALQWEKAHLHRFLRTSASVSRRASSPR